MVPAGLLRGLDRVATWSYSHSDGLVYRHGSFHGLRRGASARPLIVEANSAKLSA